MMTIEKKMTTFFFPQIAKHTHTHTHAITTTTTTTTIDNNNNKKKKKKKCRDFYRLLHHSCVIFTTNYIADQKMINTVDSE